MSTAKSDVQTLLARLPDDCSWKTCSTTSMSSERSKEVPSEPNEVIHGKRQLHAISDGLDRLD